MSLDIASIDTISEINMVRHSLYNEYISYLVLHANIWWIVVDIIALCCFTVS